MSSHTLVVDNGAWEVKAGYSNKAEPQRVFPNCVTSGPAKRALVGDQCAEARAASVVYRRAFDRGYLVNWGLEKRVWDRMLSEEVLKVNPAETHLVCTQAPFAPSKVQRALYEVAFEEYGFQSLFAPTCSAMACFDPFVLKSTPAPASVFIDAGYSFTHIVPTYDGFPIKGATRRLDVGGLLLTNHLKELISFRQWDMMDETWLVNHVKERLCFASSDFQADMRRMHDDVQHPLRAQFVLPDYKTSFTGYVKGVDEPPAAEPADAATDGGAPQSKAPPEQILKMGYERISVPEVLFNPSDIGLKQKGLAEALVDAVMACPVDLQPVMLHNVFLIGGQANMKGLAARLEKEARALIPDEFPLRVMVPEKPRDSAWRGSAAFAHRTDFQHWKVLQRQYNEFGADLCFSKFRFL